MRSLANSEDPDEMPHRVAFHQGLHCNLKRKKIIFYEEVITCNPSFNTMDHPKYIASNQKEEFIRAYRVNQAFLSKYLGQGSRILEYTGLS